ncbi:hypothetical protein A5658_06585 [Mycobacterium sp. 1245111.1]|uniref:hypothetical protein n=1 Tax=Mycobacterium sp. 1245111.1 TaxID=1834073 RepID=UPI0007FB9B5A|nr:hypothetical protein [Mycobacterium sp. 1245111.1]OBK36281.1 hypothetical protein A5658_06585 [Mycobacterium sp. 1245111.1]
MPDDDDADIVYVVPTQRPAQVVRIALVTALIPSPVTVKSADPAGQAPQLFRMRITVQKAGDGAKVPNVAFVS